MTNPAMAIQAADLIHTYQEPGLPPRTVLNIPMWRVLPGEQVLLRGKSGSGKTTLLNIIAGLLTATRGTIEVAGQDIGKLTEAQRDQFRARHIGYVFQTHNLLPFTALQNVEMPLAFAGSPARLIRERARLCLENVGLSEWANHRPHQMSAGQRLRVAVARALVTQPEILLADEPTAALDQSMSQQVMDLLQSACREGGAVLIVASHDPSLVTRFERLFDLNAGMLIEAKRALQGVSA